MMRILVLGADGRTGARVVAQALGHGHEVTAVASGPAGLPRDHPRLSLVIGDLVDPVVVREAVEGQDAVISAIDPDRSGGAHFHSDSTATAIRAMTARGVRRLVVMSSAGVGGDLGALPLTMRLLAAIPSARALREDLARMEGDVMLSDLVWTIVRPARLVDGPLTGTYRAVPGSAVPKGTRISRADVAALMLKCAEGDRYAHRAVAVAY